MAQYISKSALVVEIPKRDWHFDKYINGYLDALKETLSFINILKVKEVNI